MPETVRGRVRRPSCGRCVAALCMAFGGVVAVNHNAYAQEVAAVEFDPAFLPGDEELALDLSRFAHGNPVLPGSYDVDVWMNGEWKARKALRFETHAAGNDATPCIALDELVLFGLSPEAAHLSVDLPCQPVGRRVESATAHFDVSEQRLDIEVPQAALTRQRRGAAPSSQWDRGVTAGLLAWRTNMRHATSPHGRRTSVFLGVDGGLNWRAWRVRHAGTLSGGHYQRRHTFIERQWDAWRSQVRAGDISLADDLFTPVRLRGIGIASDPRMSGNTPGGYAPRVKGIAATHATVRVTQNGILLREISVPPGPFEIDDLHAAGRGGDIEVGVEEDDGRRRVFRVPFFPVPELLGEGRTGFAFHAGRATHGQERPAGILQASWRHGFAHDTTLYAGLRHGPHRTSRSIGGAMDTLAGAFAMDVTHSTSRAIGSGRLWRLRHGKQWRDGTLVSISASRGRDALAQSAPGRKTSRASALRRIDLLVQRDLGDDRGALSVNVGRGWQRHHAEVILDHAASWTRSWRSATFDVSLRRSSRHGGSAARRDTSAQMGFSMPLGMPTPSVSLHASVHGERAGGGVRVGLGGSMGDGAATLYGVTLAHDRRDGERVDASLSRTLALGEVAGAIDRSASTRGISLSASGGLVLHRGGVTVAQRLGDAVALVRAQGAEGARIGGHAGIRVDRRGYAAVPHLMPYRWNSVDLDPTGVSLDVAFASTHRRVVPTAGAVILIPFDTQVATTMLVTARFAGGAALPFGAEVADSGGRSVGVIGQAGRVFLRADETTGPWTVRWSEGVAGRCELRLRDNTTTAAGDVRHIGVCE